jgi:hypothetical protein
VSEGTGDVGGNFGRRKRLLCLFEEMDVSRDLRSLKNSHKIREGSEMS